MHPKAIQCGLLSAGWKSREYPDEVGNPFPLGSVCLRNGLRQNECRNGFLACSYGAASEGVSRNKADESGQEKDPSAVSNSEASCLNNGENTQTNESFHARNSLSCDNNERSNQKEVHSTGNNGMSFHNNGRSSQVEVHSVSNSCVSCDNNGENTHAREQSANNIVSCSNEQSTQIKQHTTDNNGPAHAKTEQFTQNAEHATDNSSHLFEESEQCTDFTRDQKRDSVPSLGDGELTTFESKIDGTDEKDVIPERLEELMTGLNVEGDSGASMNVKPDWLDTNKFRKGQEFLKKYFFSVFFTDVVSLLLVFSLSHILRPLIYTGRSETVWKSFKRYVSTVLHVKVWYEGDVWDASSKSRRSICAVRNIHSRMAHLMNSERVRCRVDNTSVREHCVGKVQPKCPVLSIIQADWCRGVTCPRLDMEVKNKEHTLYLSQTDMSLTQFGFMGMLLLYPEKFGAPYATREEMEAHIHFWRGCGYLLGIDDKYNFCKGSYEETLNLCKKMMADIFKPHLCAINEDFEHMSRVMLEGVNIFVPGVTFESVLLYIAWVIDLQLPALYSRITWHQWTSYWFLRFLFGVLCWIPGPLQILNCLLRGVLTLMTNPPQWWKKYGYELPIVKLNYI